MLMTMSQPWLPQEQPSRPERPSPEGFPQPSPGNALQPAWSPQWGGAAGQGLVQIGDIVCTQTEVITPSGRRPINTVVWSFTDMSQTTQSIPAWAIVLAIIFFVFCLLGLLFLLVKENRTTGWVQVTVQGDRFLHQVQLPVSSLQQVTDYNARVGYARSLSVAY
jgi:hypothetical protein